MDQAMPLAGKRLRTPRAAAIAGILFSTLLTTILLLILSSVPRDPLESGAWLGTNPHRVIIAINLMPFAGIAFLWFIGVVRDQLGEVEDRLFSTVFLGSGLLFLAMLFQGAVTATSLVAMVSGSDLDAGVWTFGRGTTEALISVYAMRMAAVFTLSVSTVALRTAAVPRWVPFSGYAVALVLLLVAGENKWAQLVFPAWVLVLSVAILLTPGRARPAAAG